MTNSNFHPKSLKDFSNISFYISAHQDDWQLFVGNLACDDIDNKNNKTVFIYTTAGDENKKDFWKAREKGAINSVKLACNLLEKHYFEAQGTESFNKRPITYFKYNNTVSYFMRLPDNKLWDLKNGIPQRTVDNTSNYSGWNTFLKTLSAIISYESRNFNDIWITTHEPSQERNPYSHNDHRMTGLSIIELASEHLGNIVLYKDYSTFYNKQIYLEPNLDSKAIMQKAGVFAGYDKTVFDESGHNTYNETVHYTQWIHRTYISRIINLENRKKILNFDSFFLAQNTPNPIVIDTDFSFILKKGAHVNLSIYNPQNELVKELLDKTIKSGDYSLRWKVPDCRNGVYFYKLQVDNESVTKKCIVSGK